MDKSNIDISVGYKKTKKVLELDPKNFLPCTIKQFERGTFRKQIFLIHYDGKKWDILEISNKYIKRYLFG